MGRNFTFPIAHWPCCFKRFLNFLVFAERTFTTNFGQQSYCRHTNFVPSLWSSILHPCIAVTCTLSRHLICTVLRFLVQVFLRPTYIYIIVKLLVWWATLLSNSSYKSLIQTHSKLQVWCKCDSNSDIQHKLWKDLH